MGTNMYTIIGAVLEVKTKKKQWEIEEKFCPKCKRVNDTDIKFCYECGYKMEIKTEIVLCNYSGYDLLDELNAEDELWDPGNRRNENIIFISNNANGITHYEYGEYSNNNDFIELTPNVLNSFKTVYQNNHSELIKKIKNHKNVISAELKTMVFSYWN